MSTQRRHPADKGVGNIAWQDIEKEVTTLIGLAGSCSTELFREGILGEVKVRPRQRPKRNNTPYTKRAFSRTATNGRPTETEAPLHNASTSVRSDGVQFGPKVKAFVQTVPRFTGLRHRNVFTEPNFDGLARLGRHQCLTVRHWNGITMIPMDRWTHDQNDSWGAA